MKIGFIKLHQIRIDFGHQNIPILSELHETFQSTGIIFSRTYLAHLFETGYDALHEVEKRLSLCIALKRSYNIICCISGFPVSSWWIIKPENPASGILPYTQVGGKILYRASDIEKTLMKGCKEASNTKGANILSVSTKNTQGF